MFRNLLDNALKYTPQNGQVSWHVHTDPENTCLISTIQDTGQGISPAQIPHIFERFYRADRARTRDIPGTGLGLSLVKSIVEAYGGTIQIKSDGIGTGTTVVVTWQLHTN